MSVARERFERHLRLAEALDRALVDRGVLQHFFVSPALPMVPLSPGELLSAWQEFAAAAHAGLVPSLVHLYLHVPFCSERCRYCVYYSEAPPRPDRVAAYLARLHAEIDHYAPALRGVGISTCYLGGGTPSVLDPGPLAELLDHLGAAFSRRRGGEWAFECNPLTLTADKARLFRDHGFNRASFGVQTANPAVLAGVNRGYQSWELVVRAVRVLAELEFWINVDLIAGLPGEAQSSMDHSLEQVLKLGPTQITVYALSPYTPRSCVAASAAPFIGDSLVHLAPLARRYGYRVSAGTTCLRLSRDVTRRPTLLDVEAHRAGGHYSYDDTTIEPFSLLGLGPTARSYLYGRLRYMADREPVDTPFAADRSCATGRRVSLAEERRRFAVHQLEQPAGLSPNEFVRLFGQRLADAFRSELAATSELGLLEKRNGAFHVRRADSLRRFATELFFVDEPMLAEAWRQLRPAASAPSSSSPQLEPRAPAVSEDEGPVVGLEAPGAAVRVILAAYWPGRPCYHHYGAFAFFVPSDLPEGTCRLGEAREQLLAAFAQLFDRVVEQAKPRQPAELMRALLGAGGAGGTLRLVAL